MEAVHAHVNDAEASDGLRRGARGAAHVDEDEESRFGGVVSALGNADAKDGGIGHEARSDALLNGFGTGQV